MKNSSLALFMSLAAALVTAWGCSKQSDLILHQREPEFYNQFANPSSEFINAEAKLNELKVLQTGEDYPMRFVLFEDGRFYYQVDKLGDGHGYWKFERGGVELMAVRPIFDMYLYLSGEDATTDNTVVRFHDRHGFNSIKINLRDPTAEASRPTDTPSKLPGAISRSVNMELRPFTYSDKGI